jgi:L-rhamnose isomerase/sugar isomerase
MSDRRRHGRNASFINAQRAYAQALLVDRQVFEGYQQSNDALIARETLKCGFATDVAPILAKARQVRGGAIDPVATYRASGYRAKVAAARPAPSGASSVLVSDV